MKWLLISNTQNRNPGDEWIRTGVERIVQEVDKSPDFTIRNKEFVEDQDKEVQFEKAIWCGSPLFWSHQFEGCWQNYWWRAWMDGWLFKDKTKVLILGVGSAIGEKPYDEKQYLAAIELVKSKCWKLVTRQKIVDDPEIQVSCCPSVFALAGNTTPKISRLCNLMPEGAHDALMNEEEAKTWRQVAGEFSRILQSLDFEIVSHSLEEDEFIKSLNWPKCAVHLKPEKSEDYFPIYSRAQVYIGNRLHGAVLTIGAEGRALAIGYDSRLGMVSYVGGTVMKPSQVTQDAICRWMDQTSVPYDWRPEYEKQVEIVRKFSEA